ncbi:MAG: 2-oxo acid dehydrogenase subunit E2 [Nitriliruptorales bacterium]|nr:2-oxo acid dehydrogenase subunit E2 [Nitriliruptorales bacterium]
MADTRDFLLPDLGEGLTEGEVVRWLVAVGDTVEIDQPIAEIETAKAVVEVPSPFEGTVIALHAEVGEEVEVGKPLLTIGSEAAPADEGGSGNVLVGYGTGNGGARRRSRGGGPGGGAGAAGHRPAHRRGPGERPLAKPPVRKLAKDLGVNLADVPGSGPEGRIVHDDVHAHARELAASQEPCAPAPVGRTEHEDEREGVLITAPDLQRLGSAPPNEQRIPVRGVRKVISEKMTRSRQEIPEATTWVDCDGSALWDVRARLNERQSEVRITPLALILRACVAGLRDYPMLGARLDTQSNEIVIPAHIHLGVATHTDRGLIVPVIKHAERRSILDLARELQRLATGAREGTLGPEELTGGTFTVSNYGSFGVDGGSAIINHPEAAILGVGRFADKPWVADGEIAVRKVVQLSIAFDHRICDGGEAAGFLRFVADCVEDPAFLLASL